MVALEMAPSGLHDCRRADELYDWPGLTPQDAARTRVIAVVDDKGETMAYVPADMAEGQARAHAAMIAAAPRLLDLARFAAANLDESSHPGVVRAFKAYCAKVVDEVEDQILMR